MNLRDKIMQLQVKIQAFKQAHHLLMTDKLVTCNYLLKEYPGTCPNTADRIAEAIEQLNVTRNVEAFISALMDCGGMQVFSLISQTILTNIDTHGGCVDYCPPKLINSILLLENNSKLNVGSTIQYQELKYGS